MSNIVDLYSEVGASLIGDDAQPSLTLTNSSTGPGLKVDRLLVTSTVTIAGQVALGGSLVGNVTIGSGATESLHVTLAKTVIGSPSVAMARFSVSGASIPVLEFQANSLVSAVSIVFAASGNWGGLSVVRVKYSDGTTYGWIPVLPNAVVTAAAI